MKGDKGDVGSDDGGNSRVGVDQKKQEIPVVGIGASAGGIGALQAFLPAVTQPCGVAFVVVQHLDPEHGSMLPEILARATSLPVTGIEDDTKIEPDHVYVIPPHAILSIENDHLRLSEPAEPRGFRTPIDSFFVSLGREKGEHAACVILSGTGSDGTVGLRAVKENGGPTFAQEGAEHDGMMRSAVATGMVDYVLPAAEMGKKLCDYFRHLREIEQKGGSPVPQFDALGQLGQICGLLRSHTSHDFGGYKQKTIARRVQRRMQVLQIGDVSEFIERLRSEPTELDALLRDLLIGVTNFFRDPNAFAALEQRVIPRLFEGKGGDDTIRVWVPGCSTGEEAYSIAMLLRERARNLPDPPKLQVFASDIDERALQIARMGRYPAIEAKDVPKQLLERYLVREDGTYRVIGELREVCLFSAHNMLRDAPFSKLDLISCRNLLIYLDPDLQNRLIPLFHYALKESGYLFLGTSENVTRHSALFATVDKTNRIFQCRDRAGRRLPEFPLTAPDGRRQPQPSASRSGAPQDSLQAAAERQLLDQFAPAYVIVDAEGEMLHASARTGKYLELAAGAPRMDIFSMARPSLRLDLRAALHRAVTTGQPAGQSGIVVDTDGGRQTMDLIVQPLRGRESPSPDPAYLLVFRDVGGVQATGEEQLQDASEELEHAGVRQLEAELRDTRQRLQTTTEELESSNEELKSSNEELSSMNEELQSANEELETSKEELQSMNEELQTVNAELGTRVEELSRANSDIANLLESTQIATVFLDDNLTVKSFTPAARDLFHLVESDTGRPISHVRSRFEADTVQVDAERVLRTLTTIERQVESTDREARYVLRILPYRTLDDVVAGVVLTFVDVTKITEAEERIGQLTRDLRDRVESLETLLDLLPVGVLLVRGTGQVQVNRHGAALLGQDESGTALRAVTAHWKLIQADRELAPAEFPLQVAAESGEAAPAFEGQLERSDGSHLEVMVSATPLFDEHGKVRGAIAALVDISERKSAEAHQLLLLNELQHRVKNVVSTIAALAARMLKTTTSLAEFEPAFQGRLRAMAGVHELLSAEAWTGADLRTVVQTILRPLVGPNEARVRVGGPAVTLSPNAASTMGLVAHELATNAIKYGALSGPDGRIELSWWTDPAARNLHFDWVERGGPAVTGTLSGGFGTDFISRSVAYELGGSAELDLQTSGLHCRIEFPTRGNPGYLGERGPKEAPNGSRAG